MFCGSLIYNTSYIITGYSSRISTKCQCLQKIKANRNVLVMFSVSMVKHSDQKQLKEEVGHLALGSRGTEWGPSRWGQRGRAAGAGN